MDQDKKDHFDPDVDLDSEKIHTERDDWEDDTEFNSHTSQSAWDRIRNRADHIMHRTIEAAGDAAAKGRLELEIASLRMRLKSLYAKIGEAVFRLEEGEEESEPTRNEEVQDLFVQVRAALGELTDLRKKQEDIRRTRWEVGA